mmetsp:Transcript_9291/g.18088  ORF Transcript_9291/g.18088 Transcript_9291/m.18088 type:complete len:250 (-) Transcript_9291:81-830(-)
MAVCSSCMLCMHSFPFVPSFFCFIYRTKSGSIDSWIDSSNYMVCVLCAYVCVFSVVDGFRGNIACVLAVASSHRIRLHPIKSFKIASPTRRLSVPYSTIHNTTQHNTAQHSTNSNPIDQINLSFVALLLFVQCMFPTQQTYFWLRFPLLVRSFVLYLSPNQPINHTLPSKILFRSVAYLATISISNSISNSISFPFLSTSTSTYLSITICYTVTIPYLLMQLQREELVRLPSLYSAVYFYFFLYSIRWR